MGIIGFKTTLPEEISSLNEVVGDLHLSPNGNHTVLTDDSKEEKIRAAVQGIRQRLSLFKGEYFLNLREGIPYFQSILVKNPNLPLIKSLIRQAIFTYPGVLSVDKIDLSLDRRTRVLTATFTVVFDDGIVVSSDHFGPVLLDLNLIEK